MAPTRKAERAAEAGHSRPAEVGAARGRGRRLCLVFLRDVVPRGLQEVNNITKNGYHFLNPHRRVSGQAGQGLGDESQSERGAASRRARGVKPATAGIVCAAWEAGRGGPAALWAVASPGATPLASRLELLQSTAERAGGMEEWGQAGRACLEHVQQRLGADALDAQAVLVHRHNLRGGVGWGVGWGGAGGVCVNQSTRDISHKCRTCAAEFPQESTGPWVLHRAAQAAHQSTAGRPWQLDRRM